MPDTDESVIDIIELTKVFRDFWGRDSVKALDSVDFQVKRGEVFGLLGPNGSGKTTCVRIILGLLFPTQGAVRLFGRSPRNVDVKKRIGYMPEESHLYSYLNAEETLDFYGRLFRLSPSDRRARTDALIEMVGLKRARTRPVGQFSKGMARRIGLAQSLINDPDLIILDEPTTGLDPIGTREMKDLVLALRKRNKTILLCSHLLGDVEEICDRICVLYGGKQRAIGSVDDLLTADDMTQIKAPRLPEETLREVIELIGRQGSAADKVEVSSPRRSLEEYFLSVVQDARRDRLTTAGAEQGTAPASFLMGAHQEAERVMQELVEAGRRETAAEAAPVAEPTAAIQTGPDEGLIGDLVARTGGAEQEAPKAAPAAEGAEDTSVRNKVLDELMDREAEDGRADEGKDS